MWHRDVGSWSFVSSLMATHFFDWFNQSSLEIVSLPSRNSHTLLTSAISVASASKV